MMECGPLPSEELYSRAQCDGGRGRLTPTGPPGENADVAAASLGRGLRCDGC